MKSYWKNNPLSVLISTDNKSQNINFKQILSNKNLLDHINEQLNYFSKKIKNINNLIYKINDTNFDINTITNFINQNYIKDFIYPQDIIKYFCEDSLIVSLYDQQNNKIILVGLIIGKKTTLLINQNHLDSVEVNFLTLKNEYRNNNLAPYLITLLTKFVIINYKLGIAHYTIYNPINSPHYCLKYFYHRPIMIKKLIKNNFFDNSLNSEEYKIYKIFNYDQNIEKYNILHLNNDTANISEDIIKLIYQNLTIFNKIKYEIYQNKTFQQFKKLFYSKSFHHFIFLDNFKIKNYFCLYQIKNKNDIVNDFYKNGFIYITFYENDPNDLIEFLSEYVYINKIFDLISWNDFFNITSCKAIQGTGFLKYYFFNTEIYNIHPWNNGLVTL